MKKKREIVYVRNAVKTVFEVTGGLYRGEGSDKPWP